MIITGPLPGMMLDVSRNLAPIAAPKPKAPSSSSLSATTLAANEKHFSRSGKEKSIRKRNKVEGRIQPQPRPHNGTPKKRIFVKPNLKYNKMPMEKTKVISCSPPVRSPCSRDWAWQVWTAMRQPLRAFFDSFAPLEGEGEVQEEEEEQVLGSQLVDTISAAELSAAKEPRCRRYHAWRTPKPQSRSLDLGTSSPSSCPAQSQQPSSVGFTVRPPLLTVLLTCNL